jgi:hypothetical protein
MVLLFPSGVKEKVYLIVKKSVIASLFSSWSLTDVFGEGVESREQASHGGWIMQTDWLIVRSK